jgi:peptidoglycan/LPS O-acetylase OafA/YrhL
MKIIYRPEIDGLRAIAVVAVILYHAQITILGYKLFSGGFIGVDIFFVISGYLITSIILKELVTTGKFSFKHFYERRIRRILPLLGFVTLLTSLISTFLMMPTLIEDVQKQSLSSILFISNFKFIFDLTEYQLLTSNYIPLLHTWSLSIEEQFYLAFPFFFIFIFFNCRKYLLFILLIILLFSLVFSDWQSNHHKIENFYFSFSRAWELLFGSVLAYIKKNITFSKNYILLNNFGLILIILSFYIFDHSLRHPSIYTLIPVLGASFIIIFNSKNSENTFTEKILKSKLLVGIGLISYSLYLWHYPILVFFNTFELLPIYKFFLLIFIFIISYCSYVFIEKPFRNKLEFKKDLVYIFSLIIFTLLVNFVLISEKFSSKLIEKFTYKNNVLDNGYLEKKIDNFFKKIKVKDFIKNKKKVLIFGDSHAKDLFLAFNLNISLFEEYDFKLINHSTSCLLNYFIKDKFCGKKISEIENSFLNNFDYIILKEKWSPEEVDDLYLNLSFLKKRFPYKTVIVVGNGPFFETKIYKGLVSTLFDQNLLLKQNLKEIELEKLYYKSYISNEPALKLDKKVREIAKDFNIIYLNHIDLICDHISQKCNFLTEENKKIFYDYGHYTMEGAKYLGKKIYETNWLKIN